MKTVQCPSCGEIALQLSSPREGDCTRCGASFRDGLRICPACGASNSISSETCQACTEPLTVLGSVIARQRAGSSSTRLEQLRGQAGAIKARSDQASAARMSELQAIDARRLEAERLAQAAQQLKDQALLRNVLIGIGIFAALIAIIALVVLL